MGRRESRPLTNVTISPGLVTIPVELHTATTSLAPSFHLIHERCGSRIQQQIYCPVGKRVVERDELVRGYELGKDQYVMFTSGELEALEGEASRAIDISEFVRVLAPDHAHWSPGPPPASGRRTPSDWPATGTTWFWSHDGRIVSRR
jgi:DNA end-binding protein Ku